MKRHLRMTLNVRFDGDDPYYGTEQLRAVTERWIKGAVEDRDDSPSVTFLLSRIDRCQDDEWEPKPGDARSGMYVSEEAVRQIWQWIIDANNGCGGDVGDLISVMNRNVLPCPADLEDN